MKVYRDATCTSMDSKNPAPIGIQSMNIQPRYLPSTAVTVDTSNKVIGYTGPDNTLTVTFKPLTTFAPGGSGKIEI